MICNLSTLCVTNYLAICPRKSMILLAARRTNPPYSIARVRHHTTACCFVSVRLHKRRHTRLGRLRDAIERSSPVSSDLYYECTPGLEFLLHLTCGCFGGKHVRCHPWPGLPFNIVPRTATRFCLQCTMQGSATRLYVSLYFDREAGRFLPAAP